VLGEEETDEWIEVGRGPSAGRHKLFLGALAPEDPLAIRLGRDDDEGAASRRELDGLAKDEAPLPAEQ
jgi:hypothetical protein